MYETHFGLKKRLFDEGVAADAAVFRNRQHTELVEQFKLAFASRTSVVVLRGPAGVGKSTLTSGALRASSTRLALAWLNGTPMNGAELLELLLVELGVNTTRTSRIERLQLWRQFQAEMAATDSRLFVVVERTEDLPVEVLHALDSSTTADAAGHPGANVVLLGHGRIEEHLADPVLDSLRQRIRLRCELKPFTEAELQEYLRHRVAVAGGDYERVFALGAVAALHRYSRGVARLTNNLCETALTLAASRSQKLLTVDLVNEAAVAWLGLGEPQPLGVPAVASTTPGATKPAAPAAPSAQPPAVSPVPAAPPTPASAVAPTVFSISPAPMAPASPPITVAAPLAFAPQAPTAVTVPSAPAASSPVAPSAPAPALPPAPAAPTASFSTRAPAVTPVPPARPAAASTPVSPPAPPAPPPAPRATPLVNAAPPKPVTAPPVAQEFDGGATDLPDVSIVDFPVLTDAVDGDEPRTPAPAPIVAAAPPKPAPKAPVAPVAPTPARSVAPAAPPTALPAARPTPPPAETAAPPRVEAAYSVARAAPPAKAAAPAAPPPKAAPPAAPVKPAAAAAAPPVAPAKPAAAVASAPSKAAPPPAPEPQEEDDLVHQTQTMRAISEAKSIVDISDSMAETLFGDAELDFLSTSLASAANWKEPDAAPAPAKPPAPAAAAKPKPAKPAPSDDDDLINLLGLADAPLELIDDSAQPPADPARKSGTQR